MNGRLIKPGQQLCIKYLGLEDGRGASYGEASVLGGQLTLPMRSSTGWGDIYSPRRCCSESLAYSRHSTVRIQLALTCVHSQGKPHSCSVGPAFCVEWGPPSLGEASRGGWTSGCPSLTASPVCWAVGDPPPPTPPLPGVPLVGGAQAGQLPHPVSPSCSSGGQALAGQSGTTPQLLLATPWAGRRPYQDHVAGGDVHVRLHGLL